MAMQPGRAAPTPRQRGFILGALGLWLVSLALPAVHVEGGPDFNGFYVLMRGWSAWRDGVYAWLANPLLLGACALGWFRVHLTTAILAGTALLLAVTSWWAPDMARAGGRALPELTYGIGFFVWLAAHAVCFAALAVGYASRIRSVHR